MHKCSSTILYAVCTFQPYKSTPVLKLFRTFTGKITRGLSLQMVFSPLFVETLLNDAVICPCRNSAARGLTWSERGVYQARACGFEADLIAVKEERLSVGADVFDRSNVDPMKCTRSMDDAHQQL